LNNLSAFILMKMWSLHIT